MSELANAGLLDLLIAPEPSASDVPGFQWSELRRVSPVLVMPESHPLAKLKRIAPARLRDLSLIGLARENFPDYVRYVRALLKPFGVAPRFVALENDGVSTLFAALEANHAAAILAEGIEKIMPRTLVTRPFSPALSAVSVKRPASGAAQPARGDFCAIAPRGSGARVNRIRWLPRGLPIWPSWISLDGNLHVTARHLVAGSIPAGQPFDPCDRE